MRDAGGPVLVGLVVLASACAASSDPAPAAPADGGSMDGGGVDTGGAVANDSGGASVDSAAEAGVDAAALDATPTDVDREWPTGPLPSVPMTGYTKGTSTVTDDVTELVWTASPAPAGKVDWPTADAWCKGLDLDGFGPGSWRLPTRMELVTIVDYSRYVAGPNPSFFSLPTEQYWTSSTTPLQGGHWAIDTLNNYVSHAYPSSRTFRAACVRGGRTTVPTPRYTTVGATVRDNVTGLIWQRAVAAPKQSADLSKAYCDDLVLDGLSDWRLPTVLELQTLVDVRRYGPSIDLASFPATAGTYFWSASRVPANTDNWYRVEFYYGEAAATWGVEPGLARCVR